MQAIGKCHRMEEGKQTSKRGNVPFSLNQYVWLMKIMADCGRTRSARLRTEKHLFKPCMEPCGEPIPEDLRPMVLVIFNCSHQKARLTRNKSNHRSVFRSLFLSMQETYIKVSGNLLWLQTLQRLNTRPISLSSFWGFILFHFFLTAVHRPQILWKFTLTFELLHFGQLPDALFYCKGPTEWRDKAVRLKEQLRSKRGTWFTRDNVTWRWERPSTWQQCCDWRKWLIICSRLWEFNLLCGS